MSIELRSLRGMLQFIRGIVLSRGRTDNTAASHDIYFIKLLAPRIRWLPVLTYISRWLCVWFVALTCYPWVLAYKSHITFIFDRVPPTRSVHTENVSRKMLANKWISSPQFYGPGNSIYFHNLKSIEIVWSAAFIRIWRWPKPVPNHDHHRWPVTTRMKLFWVYVIYPRRMQIMKCSA